MAQQSIQIQKINGNDPTPGPYSHTQPLVVNGTGSVPYQYDLARMDVPNSSQSYPYSGRTGNGNDFTFTWNANLLPIGQYLLTVYIVGGGASDSFIININ